ncbi:MAG: hypothetical protein M3336_11930 [Chloroflexota bacterium]|nr:hypothetical protein [Chloroflexota bacterium]
MTRDDEQPRDTDKEPHEEEVILLEDLAPRGDVKGGAGKILFGEAAGDDALDVTHKTAGSGGESENP